MKKVNKKISAVALSLAILGTASVIPGNYNPMVNSTIVASAANYTQAYWIYSRPTGGSRNTASKVKWIQAAINNYFGYGLLDVDGIYGSQTTKAVKKFQQHFNDHHAGKKNKLAVDGDFGPATYNAFVSLGY